MADFSTQNIVSLPRRQALISAFPCFATLSEIQSQELAALMTEVRFAAHDKIVLEDQLIDSVYILVHGEAEVTRINPKKKKIVQVPVAVLRGGEAIGLNDTGFYSNTGKRTATVTAIKDVLALRLDLKDLYEFLKAQQLENAMYAASQQMLRMLFIKQSLPFSKLSHHRLQWLADRVVEVFFSAGDIIFKQGDEGNKCYIIQSGQVEIVNQDDEGGEHRLAVLKSKVLFGEATLITHTPRNASARALEDTVLMELKHEDLSELIETENNVASMFMTLMVDRSRPIQNPNASIHKSTSADGQPLTILKNPDNGNYFKLSQEGTFIWKQLDGKHTLQEITLNLADEYNVFAPNIVAALISKLTKAGFVQNLQIENKKPLTQEPLWVRSVLKLQKILEFRKAFGDADPWMTYFYQKYIRYFFTKPAQWIISFVACIGFLSFCFHTSHVLNFFGTNHASLWLILMLVPLSTIEVFLHEFGHAFAVKAVGREVHYVGVGWFWVSPVAFTDTSDMWLSTRKPRMLVNLAGVIVDVLVAGTAGILMLMVSNPYVEGILWLFILYTYIGAFRMLSPLQEMDGYYVLMDWVEKNHLRQLSVVWLIKKLPEVLKHPSSWRKYKPEIIYWTACFIYLALLVILTFVLQAFVFDILGIHSNPYVSLILPFLVVIVSSLSIVAEIRNQAES